MFRKTSLLVGMLALMLVAPQAHAAKGDMMLGLSGGVAAPMSDFGDDSKLGYMGGVDFDYMMNDAVALGIDGSYVQNSAKDEALAVSGFTDAKQTIIQFGAHAKYMFPMQNSSLSPYIVGGLGGYNGKADLTPEPTPAPESSTNFGGRIGLGLGFQAGSRAKVGIESNYHYISTSDPDPKVQYVSVTAGVSFALGGSSSGQ